MIKIILPRRSNAGSNTDRENLGQWMNNRLYKWNNFTNNDTELTKWFEGWIRHIVEFERKNIKILGDKLDSSSLFTI